MSMNEMTRISFLHVTASGQFIAIFKQPRNSLSRNLLTSSFTKNCWIVLIVSWVIIALIVKLVPILQGKLYACHTKGDLAFFDDILLWTLTTAIGKAWFVNPTTRCLKMICLVSAGLTCCLYAVYLSQFTVNLITENQPIKTFQDLMQSNFELYTDKWLPPSVVVRRRHHNHLDENVKLDVDEGLRTLMRPSSLLAFVTLSDSISNAYFGMNYTDITFCKTLSRVQLYNQKTPAAMFVKKGSPLKEKFNFNILKLVESGITNRLNNQYSKRTEIQCLPIEHNYRGGLGWHDVFTSFLVLAAGFCVSNVFVIHEFMVENLKIVSNSQK